MEKKVPTSKTSEAYLLKSTVSLLSSATHMIEAAIMSCTSQNESQNKDSTKINSNKLEEHGTQEFKNLKAQINQKNEEILNLQAQIKDLVKSQQELQNNQDHLKKELYTTQIHFQRNHPSSIKPLQPLMGVQELQFHRTTKSKPNLPDIRRVIPKQRQRIIQHKAVNEETMCSTSRVACKPTKERRKRATPEDQ